MKNIDKIFLIFMIIVTIYFYIDHKNFKKTNAYKVQILSNQLDKNNDSIDELYIIFVDIGKHLQSNGFEKETYLLFQKKWSMYEFLAIQSKELIKSINEINYLDRYYNK